MVERAWRKNKGGINEIEKKKKRSGKKSSMGELNPRPLNLPPAIATTVWIEIREELWLVLACAHAPSPLYSTHPFEKSGYIYGPRIVLRILAANVILPTKFPTDIFCARLYRWWRRWIWDTDCPHLLAVPEQYMTSWFSAGELFSAAWTWPCF